MSENIDHECQVQSGRDNVVETVPNNAKNFFQNVIQPICKSYRSQIFKISQRDKGTDEKQSPHVFFSRTTEDTELGTKVLDIQPTDTVLVVAGSGDQVLDALCFRPQKVIACDISSEQLNLTKLKIIFAKYLPREEFVTSLGLYENNPFSEASRMREALWEKVYHQANEEERIVLSLFKESVRYGIADGGKASVVPRAKLQNILSNIKKGVPHEWFDTMIGKTGTRASRAHMKSTRFVHQLVRNLVFLAPYITSPRIVKESTREQLKEIYKESIREFYEIYLYGLVRHPLTSHMFAPDFESCDEEALPLHLRKDIYPILQENVRIPDKIRFIEGDLGTTDFWSQFDDKTLNKVYLSSVPVWISPIERSRLFGQCVQKLDDKGLVFTCSHDLKDPVPDNIRDRYQRRVINRSIINDRPSDYYQEVLLCKA